jgi:hypothetical protein
MAFSTLLRLAMWRIVTLEGSLGRRW